MTLHSKSSSSTGPPNNSSASSDPTPTVKEYSRNKTFGAGIALVLLTAYGIRYAHNSPEFRDTLSLYLPWLDDFIAVIYQENMSYQDYFKNILNKNLEINKYVTLMNTAIGDRRLRESQKCEGSLLFHTSILINKVIGDMDEYGNQMIHFLKFIAYQRDSTLPDGKQFAGYNLVSIDKFPRNYAVKLPRKLLSSPRTREPCPLPPPPPPKPPKEDALLWGTLCALLIASIGIVTAKGSPQIRDWLTIYAPYIDNLIAVLYEENMSHSEFAAKCIDDIYNYFNPKPCGKDVALKGDQGGDDDEGSAGGSTVMTCTTDICTVEKCLDEAGESIISNYTRARDACNNYTKQVDEIMSGKIKMEDFDNLREAKHNRDTTVKECLDKACEGIKKIDEMNRYLDCGVTASKQEVENVKLKYRNFQSRSKVSHAEYLWADQDAQSRDDLMDIVAKGIKKCTEEVETLIPSYKFGGDKPFIGDPNLLLFSIGRLVKRLNEEYDVRAVTYDERVNRAYENLVEDDDPKAAGDREAKTKAIYAIKAAELAKQVQARLDKLHKEIDHHLKELLKNQHERFEHAMHDKLEAASKKASEELDKEVEKKLAHERIIFETARADMEQRLSIVEEKFNARMKVEKETRRSQDLWAAGASLIEATKTGCIDGPNHIKRHLDAIEKASTDDKLVKTVLKSISPEIRETGIYPETKLKESYQAMEDTAMKIALVEEDGSILPVYALSWLQSFLLNWKIPGIPQSEFEHPPKEIPDYLDTFDLLQRSRFWINQGNLAQAVAYVDHLKGASRLAAQTWLVSARNNIQVRQAAEAIKAHATALGLQYV